MLVFQIDPVGVEPNYVKMFFCSNKFASLLDTWLKTLYTGSPHVTESKTVLDSGFRTVEFGFQVLDSSLCQWNLDSGFQSLVGFRTPCTVFRILKPRIPNSTCTIFPDFGSRKKKFPESGIPYTGRTGGAKFSPAEEAGSICDILIRFYFLCQTQNWWDSRDAEGAV